MAPRERRNRLTDDIEENDEGIDDTAEIVRQGRRVRVLASVALLAALIVTVGVGCILVKGDPLQRANERTAIALHADDEAQMEGNNKTFVSGWYHVYLNTVLRKELSTDSELLQKIPVGSRLYLVEKHGRRARVEQPVKGWTSMETADGVVIVRPEMRWAQDKVSQGKAAAVHEQVAKFTKLETQLIDTLKMINENIIHPQMNSAFGGAAGIQRAQKAFAHGAADVSNAASTAFSETRHSAENILKNRFTINSNAKSQVPAEKLIGQGFGAVQHALGA